MVGVAVKVTDVPAQIELSASDEDIVTAGVTTGNTVVAIVLLVTVAGAAQVALLVRLTEITSPLVRVLVTKVEPGVNLSCPYWSSVTDQRGLEPQPLMGMQRRPSNITPLDYCRGQPSIGLKQTLPRVSLKVRLPTLKRVVCPSSP